MRTESGSRSRMKWNTADCSWEHGPITDFWRIGRGYARKLAENGMKTMGDVARCSVGGPNDYHNEGLL